MAKVEKTTKAKSTKKRRTKETRSLKTRNYKDNERGVKKHQIVKKKTS